MIEIVGLNKRLGENLVLNNINLSINKGSITGLLGPNGAGKTTLVSILTGIITKDSGHINISGYDFDKNLKDIKNICSIVPQSLAFYPTLTIYENLEYFAALSNIKQEKMKPRIEFSVEFGSLNEHTKKRAGTLSGGLKRRLNLAIGLLSTPEILFLDEPTVGVDAQSRNYILHKIKELNKENNTTVIYTSHYMDEIEQISDYIVILDEGEVIFNDIKGRINIQKKDVLIYISGLDASIHHKLIEIYDIKVNDDIVYIPKNNNLNSNLISVFSILKDNNITIADMDFVGKNLEELFLILTNKRLRD